MIKIEFKLILARCLISDLMEMPSAFLDKFCGQTEEIAKPKGTISPSNPVSYAGGRYFSRCLEKTDESNALFHI
jgi:hypothetical protein